MHKSWPLWFARVVLIVVLAICGGVLLDQDEPVFMRALGAVGCLVAIAGWGLVEFSKSGFYRAGHPPGVISPSELEERQEGGAT